MPRKALHILHHLHLPRCRRCAAYAAAERNLRAGRPALKWAKMQHIAAGKVEARPVDIRQRFIQQRGCVRQRRKRLRILCQGRNLLCQQGIQRCFFAREKNLLMHRALLYRT